MRRAQISLRPNPSLHRLASLARRDDGESDRSLSVAGMLIRAPFFLALQGFPELVSELGILGVESDPLGVARPLDRHIYLQLQASWTTVKNYDPVPEQNRLVDVVSY